VETNTIKLDRRVGLEVWVKKKYLELTDFDIIWLKSSYNSTETKSTVSDGRVRYLQSSGPFSNEVGFPVSDSPRGSKILSGFARFSPAKYYIILMFPRTK